MGYVAVKGGTKAIEASIERLVYERLNGKKVLEVEAIEKGMRGLVDQVMSESSLYGRELAALAIKQAEGSMEEAVFLLRSYRSTLPRKHYTEVVDTSDMQVERRISASFKDIPGGQVLGSSYDYTHRLINFDLLEEKECEIDEALKAFKEKYQQVFSTDREDIESFPKVIDYLREEGLILPCEASEEEPIDITKKNLEFPTTRSVRLQTLTRGQTGAVTSLGYAALRAYGDAHPTVGELRVGELPLYVPSPMEGEEEGYYIGKIQVTEVEALIPQTIESPSGEKEIMLAIGYGIAYGQNETKAIAMSILDNCLTIANPKYPTHDEEFVLLHIDSVEASGFISHLKLPHYVTFQSKLDSVRKTKRSE